VDIWITAVTIGLGVAIAASIGAISQSRAIWRAVEAIARQPEAGGRIFTALLMGLALIETLVLFTVFVLGFLIKPSLDQMIQAKYGKEALEYQKLTDTYDKEKKTEGKH
jgi:F-type H+-transporting ATPase subunit c